MRPTPCRRSYKNSAARKILSGKRCSDQLKEKQNRWEREARKVAVPVLEKAQFLLQQAGVAPDRIESRVLVLMHRGDLVDEIIKTAHECRCNTIITGRNAFPWLKELFVDHLGDEISRRAKGITVNVV